MGPGIPGAVVPQFPVPSDGDLERHHPSLRTLYQAQRPEAALPVSLASGRGLEWRCGGRLEPF